MDYKNIKNEVISIVKSSADIFHRGAERVVEKDGAANLVTDVDLAIQHYLQEELHRLLPEAGFFCEEENIIETEKDYVWVIDPVDGTMNFSRNLPECVISVGLLYKRQAVVGVVFAPRLALMFSASKGNGAYCNHEKIRVSEKTFEQALFCTGLCLYEKNLSPFCSEIIARAHNLCSDIRRFGACALEICYLALGRCDLFFEIRTYPWDYAAAYLILSEAGGILRGFQKKELGFDNITMLVGANNVKNFEKLNDIISDVITEEPKYRW